MPSFGGEKESLEQYTVFLIEDDVDDAWEILQTLKSSPYIYNVHCFDSGDKLMDHLKKESYYSRGPVHKIPMMILLDLHLPGTSGMEVLEMLKDNPLTHEIPVVIISNDISSNSIVGAYAYEANAYVSKPVCIDRIHEVIHKNRV